MNRNALSVLLAFSLAGVSGCSTNGTFYAIQPGQTSQLPARAFVAKFTVHLSKMTMLQAATVPVAPGKAQGWLHASGVYRDEKFAGDLPRVFPNGPSHSAVPIPDPMQKQWDSVYGQGSYVGEVLGTGQDARGILTGSKGTTMKVEIHTQQAANSQDAPDVGLMRGVAEDSKGQLYKIAF